MGDVSDQDPLHSDVGDVSIHRNNDQSAATQSTTTPMGTHALIQSRIAMSIVI